MYIRACLHVFNDTSSTIEKDVASSDVRDDGAADSGKLIAGGADADDFDSQGSRPQQYPTSRRLKTLD